MKIVFFVNVIRQARCIRRINDFINRKYDIEVFAFDRKGDNRNLPNFKYEILGKISNDISYFKRLQTMTNAIKNVLDKQPKDTIYYLFNLDIAIAFILASKRKLSYLYEVSDLMELDIKNRFISKTLVSINKYIIKNSIETIMTSTGFKEYLFHDKKVTNISIVPNKLNRKCLELPTPTKRDVNLQSLSIGFTGAIRNKAIYNFIKVIGENFPNHTIKLYGIFNEDKSNILTKNAIEKFQNIEYHGPFKNPEDFTNIYSNVDIVLCLYGSSNNNKVLEPNKLYEAIFYEKPIIVSKDTFLEKRVKELGVGFSIDGANEIDIINFIKSLKNKDFNNAVENCKKIDKKSLVDDASRFFLKLEHKINMDN